MKNIKSLRLNEIFQAIFFEKALMLKVLYFSLEQTDQF